MGRIEVTVCEARKLHDCQRIGMPDPFVRITCEEKKYKTAVRDNTLEPKWNETYRFQISDEMSSQLVMEIWNKNIASDDLMGRYTLSLGGLTRGVVKDQWYILDKSKTEAELRVRVLAVDFGRDPKPAQKWMVTHDISRDPVQRAIEDGKWCYGQTEGAAPAMAGPPASPPAAVPPPQQPPVNTPPPQQQAVLQPTAPGAPTVTVQYGNGYQQQPPQQQPPYGGYPPQQQPPYGGYPPQQPPYGGYPPQQPPYGGYPPQQQPPYGGYPPQQPPYGGYPPQQPAYGAYPQQPYGAYPPQQY